MSRALVLNAVDPRIVDAHVKTPIVQFAQNSPGAAGVREVRFQERRLGALTLQWWLWGGLF